MPIVTKKVTYIDGRDPVTIRISPRAQVMMEQHLGREWANMPLIGTYYSTWAALMKQDPASVPDFETWLDLVEQVEDAQAPEPDPTQPGPSGDTSST